MVPAANARHAILNTNFNRIEDLIKALRDRGIIPSRIPKTGWGEFSYTLDRFNAEFRLMYALSLLEPRIDAYREDGKDLHRVALSVNPARFRIQLIDTRDGRMLTDFDFAMAGRAAISAEVRIESAQRAAYVDFHEFVFRIDDTTRQVPLPLPIEDLEWIVERGVNRDFRGEYGGNLPEKNLPITAGLNDGNGINLFFGHVLRDIESRDDWFAHKLCLPGHVCVPAQPETKEFFTYFDLWGRLDSAQTPVPIDPLRTPRHFQADVGRDIVDLALNAVKGMPEVADVLEGHRDILGGVFRADWKVDFKIAAWRDPDKSGGDAAIEVEGYLDFQIAYPRIKWCKKKVFGVEIPYPCGIEIGYARMEKFELNVQVQPYLNGNEICVKREKEPIKVISSTTIIGHIVKFIVAVTVGALLGLFIPVAGPALGFGVGVMVFVALESLARIISIIANKRIPTSKCKSIDEYLTVPVVKGKIDAEISNPKMSFDLTGTSLTFDGDFRAI